MAMRKLLFIATIVGAISAFAPAPAWASSSHAQVVRPAALFGYGSLGQQFGDPTVQMEAVQTFGRPTGEFVIAYPNRTVVFGVATCLSVSGHTAYLTGKIRFATGPGLQAASWFAGNYIIIGVQDNGSAGPDLLNFSPGFATNPGCGPNPTATPVFPITRGNFLVFGGSWRWSGTHSALIG
jgi:hypothetical protein